MAELDIVPAKVELGEVETQWDISKEEKEKLSLKISKVGLEILEKENGVLAEKIKTAIIEYVYHTDGKPGEKLSTFLSKKLKKSYGYLTNYFAETEGSTIEQYLAALKIERVKELIIFDENTMSQIAFKLHYSSVAHLSKQFKKVTGLTPSQFKALKDKRRQSIQEL